MPTQVVRQRAWRYAASVALVGLIGFAWLPAPSGAVSRSSALPTAYVTNSQLNTVSVFVGSTFAGTVQNVGSGPTGIAIDGPSSSAYVADYGFLNQPRRTVTPIDLTTGTAGTPIRVGTGPLAIAITPGGKFALVTLQGTASHPGHQVVEVNLATRQVSAPVPVGLNPESLAITPDGTKAYVGALSSAEVTPVDLTTWPPTALLPIPLSGTAPRAIAVSPDGSMAYVLDAENATIIPIELATGAVGPPVNLVCHMQGDPGCTPDAIVISPDGRTAYVAAAGSGDAIILNLPSLTVAGVVQTGGYPDALGLGGHWLYVANGASNTVTAFSGLRSPWEIGGVTYPFGIAVVPGRRPGSALGNTIFGTLPAAGNRGAAAAAVPAHPKPFYGLPPA
jgi:DNA-binding beta-propeller fold protein YncE